MLGCFSFFRENLSQWEKIARGEVEDTVPSRPCESGPVKVDNWLKGFLSHHRNTSWILPQSCNILGGKTHKPVLDQEEMDQLKATWEKHTVTSLGDGGVDTDDFADPRDWQTACGEGLQPITPRPLSLGFYLVEWTFYFACFVYLIMLFSFMVLYLQRPYSEPFTG